MDGENTYMFSLRMWCLVLGASTWSRAKKREGRGAGVVIYEKGCKFVFYAPQWLRASWTKWSPGQKLRMQLDGRSSTSTSDVSVITYLSSLIEDDDEDAPLAM